MRRVFWCVLLSVLPLGISAGDELTTRNLIASGVLQTRLQESLLRARELSVQLETRIESLLLQIESSRTLLDEQSTEIRNLQEISERQKSLLERQAEKLLRSQNSLIASSASWEIYSREAEAEIGRQHRRAVQAERRSRIHRLVWQIGIPAGILLGGAGGWYVATR